MDAACSVFILLHVCSTPQRTHERDETIWYDSGNGYPTINAPQFVMFSWKPMQRITAPFTLVWLKVTNHVVLKATWLKLSHISQSPYKGEQQEFNATTWVIGLHSYSPSNIACHDLCHAVECTTATQSISFTACLCVCGYCWHTQVVPGLTLRNDHCDRKQLHPKSRQNLAKYGPLRVAFSC